MLSTELTEAIAGSKKHSTFRQGHQAATSGRSFWGDAEVVTAMRGYADEAGGRNRMLLLVLASAIKDKDKRAAKRTYAKLPRAIRDKYVVVGVRDELDEAVELNERQRRSIEKPQKCKSCASPASKGVVWADGRAYVPSCEKHLAGWKKKLSDVVSVREIPVSEEALFESYPDAMKKVLAKLKGKMKKLWLQARNDGLDTLRLRDKYMLMQALEKAAESAGFTTPAMQARVVDQAMAWTTPY